MAAYLICMFGGSLALTVAIELAVAFLLGMRTGRDLFLVVLVNLLTNPPAVLCNWLCSLYLPGYRALPVQLVIEAAVVATEALIYHIFAADRRWTIRRPGRLSLVCNGCSWLLGLLF